MKYFKYLFFVIVFGNYFNGYSQKIQWAVNIGGMNDDESNSIATDINDNIYITGYYKEDVDFDPSPKTDIRKDQAWGAAFLSKYNKNGEYLWTTDILCPSSAIGYCVKVDKNQNVYIAGNFQSEISFTTVTKQNLKFVAKGNSDMFIAKYNEKGKFIWAKQIKGDDYIEPSEMIIDKNNNLLLIGRITGKFDFDPSIKERFLEPKHKSSNTIFLAKYNEVGNLLFAYSIGGDNGGNCGLSIQLDHQENILISGFFQNTVDFDVSNNIKQLTSNGKEMPFIAKYSKDMVLKWVKSINCIKYTTDMSLTIDSKDNLVVTGSFDYPSEFNQLNDFASKNKKGSDVFIAKYASEGTLLWSNSIGGASDNQSKSVVIDKNDDIYIGCNFFESQNLMLNSHEFIPKINSKGSWDILIVKFGSNGKYKWAFPIGGKYRDEVHALTIDNSQNLCITGYITLKVDIDCPKGSINLKGEGGYDIFIAKMNIQ